MPSSSASRTSRSTEGGAMRFMNRWDIEDAVRHFADDPVLGPASRTLLNLMEWTDSHSDGWAYWPKPCRAAAKLQALLEENHPYRRDWDAPAVTVAQYAKALVPIKAFRTRQAADFVIVEA